MRSQFSRGVVARLYFDIIIGLDPVISQTPTVAIKRLSDGKWLQVSDGTWQTDIVQNAMTQLDATNLPGRYYFDFDQELDEGEGSVEYIVRKTNTGDNATLEYEDLLFGPIAATVAPALCSVQGSIFTPQGDAVPNAQVRATLQPVFKDGVGRAVQSDRLVVTYTDGLGDFDLPLVRGGIFRLEIPEVGYDRKVTIPDQSSALFTDL